MLNYFSISHAIQACYVWALTVYSCPSQSRDEMQKRVLHEYPVS